MRKGNHLEHSDINGRIILRWIFRKRNSGLWVGGHLL
jgi:hypothetical protein